MNTFFMAVASFVFFIGLIMVFRSTVQMVRSGSAASKSDDLTRSLHEETLKNKELASKIIEKDEEILRLQKELEHAGSDN